MCIGSIQPDSKAEILRIIDAQARHGVDAEILGRTEIGMLVNQVDTDVRLFDTTPIHAEKMVVYARGAE